MQAQIYQEDGRLYFQMEIKSFPTEPEILDLTRQAVRELAEAKYRQVLKEVAENASFLTVKEVAELMRKKTTEPVYNLMELPKGHPRRLKHVYHEDKRYWLVTLEELKRWARENSEEGIEQHIRRFEKSAKNRK